MKTVTLSRRYDAHGKALDALTFRTPTGADYWTVGGPIAERQPVGEGQAVIVHHDRIKAYAERLLVMEDRAVAALILQELDLADVLRVEDAIRDFFSAAMTSNGPSTS